MQKKREQIKGRSHYHKKKIEWKKTVCPSCQHRFQYAEVKGWYGKLKCPECGYVWEIKSLDEFFKP